MSQLEREFLEKYGNWSNLKKVNSRKPRVIQSNKKEDISASLRWEVWERDNFTCQHCGSRRFLTIDHIYPEALGGTATKDNCQTLCNTCNAKKGARV